MRWVTFPGLFGVAIFVGAAWLLFGRGDSPDLPAAEAMSSADSVTGEKRDELSFESRGPCGALPFGAIPGVSVRKSIETSAGRREYLLFRPSGPSADTRIPLVLNFHGRGSDAATQERYSGLLPLAERAGFVLVTPEGTGSPRAWSAGATAPGGVDDVAFVAQLVATIEEDICIDDTRIYATGFSNGAFMASRVSCELGRIAAFAAVAGVASTGGPCRGDVPVLALHGTRDGIVPFEKGSIRNTYPYAGARGELQSWAANNGCTSKPVSETISANVTRESFVSGRAPVVLYVVQGGGHTWPGAPDIPELGVTVKELNAAETIWAFFSSYSKPG